MHFWSLCGPNSNLTRIDWIESEHNCKRAAVCTSIVSDFCLEEICREHLLSADHKLAHKIAAWFDHLGTARQCDLMFLDILHDKIEYRKYANLCTYICTHNIDAYQFDFVHNWAQLFRIFGDNKTLTRSCQSWCRVSCEVSWLVMEMPKYMGETRFQIHQNSPSRHCRNLSSVVSQCFAWRIVWFPGWVVFYVRI